MSFGQSCQRFRQDQGATRLTMARLDRMISIATKPDARRRY